MAKKQINDMLFASVYLMYVAKAEKKGRTKNEVDQIIVWLTGYTSTALHMQIQNEVNMERFFREAPRLNPNRELIKGVICGIRVEQMEESLMKEVRYLDKMIDELAKGKSMDKILRE